MTGAQSVRQVYNCVWGIFEFTNRLLDVAAAGWVVARYLFDRKYNISGVNAGRYARLCFLSRRRHQDESDSPSRMNTTKINRRVPNFEAGKNCRRQSLVTHPWPWRI